MSTVLTGDQSQAFERWVLPQVGSVVPVVAPVPELPPPGPSLVELEDIERHAREEGYAAGLAEGLAAGRDQIKAQLARLDALCEAAARPLAALDDVTEQELARLAVVMARRVVARELVLDPSLIVQAVRQAAASLPSATRELRVWVNPQDMNLLQELAAEEPHWRFGANPALQRGDCLLESTHSRLDASVQARLSAVIDAVLGADLSETDADQAVAP